MHDVQIEASWKEVLADEFKQDYFAELSQFLKMEKQQGTCTYPLGKQIFQAFWLTPFPEVRVVILGQDPYHNPGEAMGLSFSVPKTVRLPPSLKNIYKELKTDLGVEIAPHGDLSAWAEQGVFLLNAMLTVAHKQAGSHRNIGWQRFTDAVIRKLSEQREHLVFMLWGNFARQKSQLIDGNRHLILEAAHPSPLARGAFFGSKHFSQANTYLEAHGYAPIRWDLPA